MTTFKLLVLTIINVGLGAQAPHNPPDQPPASQQSKQLYQRPQTGRPYQPRQDFFQYSTKLVNRNDNDYGAWMEERRRALVDASLTNPFFWYSALTTSLVMLLMLMYGVRVLNERRKLWRAAELLADIWNQDQHSRLLATDAIEKHNGHMAECNRVVEAQLSGRPSAVALEAGDAKHVVE